MKKFCYWIILTITNIMHIYFSHKAFQYAEKTMRDSDIDNVSSLLFIPIFMIIIIGLNVVSNIFLILTSIFYLKNDDIKLSNFIINKDDHVSRKVIKIIGYLFIYLYMHMAHGSNIYEIMVFLTSIIISIILVIWIDATMTKYRKPY